MEIIPCIDCGRNDILSMCNMLRAPRPHPYPRECWKVSPGRGGREGCVLYTPLYIHTRERYTDVKFKIIILIEAATA